MCVAWFGHVFHLLFVDLFALPVPEPSGCDFLPGVAGLEKGGRNFNDFRTATRSTHLYFSDSAFSVLRAHSLILGVPAYNRRRSRSALLLCVFARWSCEFFARRFCVAHFIACRCPFALRLALSIIGSKIFKSSLQ